MSVPGPAGSGRAVRWVRRALLGRGPLKRRVDHVETALRLVAALAVVAAVVLGAVVGLHVGDGASARQQARDSATELVTAHVDAPPSRVPTGLLTTAPYARSTWSDPTRPHRLRHEIVQVPPWAHQGANIALQVSTSTGGPLPAAGAGPVVLGVSAGVATVLVLLLPVLAGYWALRPWLQRIRARTWDTEWARVEPQWTTRR